MGDPDIVRDGPRLVELTVHSELNILNMLDGEEEMKSIGVERWPEPWR